MSSACATSDASLPSWFDAIERIPLKSVQVQGHRIAYLDSGDGPPVILLHGFGGSMWQWEHQQSLSSGLRVITPDLLGSGLSDKPEIQYSPQEMMDFLTAFMDALEIPHAVLVGHSMGAGLAIGMALEHPERLTKLVLISGLPQHVMENLTNPMIRRALETRAPAWMVASGNWLLGGFFTERVLKDIVYDHALLTPAVLDRSNRNRKRPGLLGPVMSAGKHLPVWESRFAPRMASITQDTLIVWGEEDHVFPLAVGAQLHTTLPASTFIAIPRAGHMPQWEQPQVVNRHLLQFVRP
jgi:pimeloyl-ACP methyl ester carboxylesterase